MSSIPKPLPASAYVYADGEPIHYVTDKGRSRTPQPMPADTPCPVWCRLPHTFDRSSHHRIVGEVERPGLCVQVAVNRYGGPTKIHLHIIRTDEQGEDKQTEELVLPPLDASKLAQHINTALVQVVREYVHEPAEGTPVTSGRADG